MSAELNKAHLGCITVANTSCNMGRRWCLFSASSISHFNTAVAASRGLTKFAKDELNIDWKVAV
ncbi:hypothetical protein C5C07_17535 [Haloferax sp. Atlit-4N]|nr:hypothetical protein C5C07_17535 [Haloferax sp. Atlit-4N]